MRMGQDTGTRKLKPQIGRNKQQICTAKPGHRHKARLEGQELSKMQG